MEIISKSSVISEKEKSMTSFQKDLVKKAIKYANLLIKNKVTVREVAEKLKVPKSTVYEGLERVQTFDPELYKKVEEVLRENKSQRYNNGIGKLNEEFITSKPKKT